MSTIQKAIEDAWEVRETINTKTTGGVAEAVKDALARVSFASLLGFGSIFNEPWF